MTVYLLSGIISADPDQTITYFHSYFNFLYLNRRGKYGRDTYLIGLNEVYSEMYTTFLSRHQMTYS